MKIERERQRLPTAERSRELLSIAKELFVKHGPRGMKLREVARRASVSAPSVYNHFDSLEDMLAAILEEHLSDLLLLHSEIASMAPVSAIRSLCVGHTRLLARNPAAAHLLTTDMQLRHTLLPMRKIADQFAQANHAEEAILRRGLAAGEFREVYFFNVILARIGMTTTMLSTISTDGRTDDDQVTIVGETVADYTVRYLKK